MTPPHSPSYREIPLSKGQVAIVDTDDYEYLSQFSWHANDSHKTYRYYAYRRHYVSLNPRVSFLVAMHREIMGLQRGDKKQVDHKNPALTLDNRRSNLRIVSPTQNMANQRKRSANTSGFKGVSLHRKTGKWGAYISIRNRTKYLGLFATPEEAHQVYKTEAELRFGEFARME